MPSARSDIDASRIVQPMTGITPLSLPQWLVVYALRKIEFRLNGLRSNRARSARCRFELRRFIEGRSRNSAQAGSAELAGSNFHCGTVVRNPTATTRGDRPWLSILRSFRIRCGAVPGQSRASQSQCGFGFEDIGRREVLSQCCERLFPHPFVERGLYIFAFGQSGDSEK